MQVYSEFLLTTSLDRYTCLNNYLRRESVVILVEKYL
jgi:hypothetical protein